MEFKSQWGAFVILGIITVLVCGHPEPCIDEWRLTEAGFAECMWETKFLGEVYSPSVPASATLQTYIHVLFETPELTLTDLCCQDSTTFEASSIRVNHLAEVRYPSYQLRAYPHFEFEFVPNSNISEEDLHAMFMVDLSGYRLDQFTGYPGRPALHWLITNMQGLDIYSGDIPRHYYPPFGDDLFMFLWYRQPAMIEFNLGSYASFGEGCADGYSDACIYNVAGVVSDFNLTLIGISWVRSQRSLYSAYLLNNDYQRSNAESCQFVYPDISVEGNFVNCNAQNAALRSMASFYIMAIVSMVFIFEIFYNFNM